MRYEAGERELSVNAEVLDGILVACGVLVMGSQHQKSVLLLVGAEETSLRNAEPWDES